MGDKEILAELKQCYELLEDIIDNADNTQLKSVKELHKTLDILAKKYEEIYNKIKAENDISLYYEENIKICSNIYGDYINEDDDYITAGDLDWQKWWKDDRFIKEF